MDEPCLCIIGCVPEEDIHAGSCKCRRSEHTSSRRKRLLPVGVEEMARAQNERNNAPSDE